MAENPSSLSTPEKFHTEIVSLVKADADRTHRVARTSSGVRPHPEGRPGFEKELADRLVVRPRTAVRTGGGVSSVRALSAGASRSGRSSSGLPMMLILVVILGLAAYLAFFDDGGESAESEQELAEGEPTRAVIPEPSRRSTGPINYFNVAIDGFDQLLAGRLKPEVEEKSFASLKSKLQEDLGKPIEFEGVTAPLIGGDLAPVRDLQVPRFLYRSTETVLLVTEVTWDDLVNENGVYVAPDILAQLEAGESVFTPGPSNGTIALFRKGESAVIAVSDRSEPDLATLLGI